MKSWNRRPREIRNLFNPAFCGLVIARGVEGFTAAANLPMPFSLTLLILPLCLHKRTRDQIKEARRAYFTKILQEHPEIRVDLAQRARGLVPYTMEAFAYLMACGAIIVDDSGSIEVRESTIRKSIIGSQDTKDCQMVARSLGRKLALVNDRVTIYTTLGIRP
ncbi:MAG: three component ABC system middle component [Thermodesulfovibrionales bacterium]